MSYLPVSLLSELPFFPIFSPCNSRVGFKYELVTHVDIKSATFPHYFSEPIYLHWLFSSQAKTAEYWSPIVVSTICIVSENDFTICTLHKRSSLESKWWLWSGQKTPARTEGPADNGRIICYLWLSFVSFYQFSCQGFFIMFISVVLLSVETNNNPPLHIHSDNKYYTWECQNFRMGNLIRLFRLYFTYNLGVK